MELPVSETTNPAIPIPGFASKSEGGASSVTVSVGTPPAPHDPGGASKTGGIREYWPMIAFLVGAVFSAGVLWNKVDQLETQQASLEKKLDKNFKALSEKLDDITVMSILGSTSDDF